MYSEKYGIKLTAADVTVIVSHLSRQCLHRRLGPTSQVHSRAAGSKT